MKRSIGTLLVASALLVFGCNRDEGVASTSAAAQREAHETGTPAGAGHDHGGHQAATATSGTAAIDHSAHGAGADPHAGHDMSGTGTADHSGHRAAAPSGTAAIDHSAHRTGADPHAGHDMSRTRTADHSGHEGRRPAAGAATHDRHTGMQHAAPTTTGASHAQHAQPAAGASAGHAQHGVTTPAATDPHAGHTMPAPPATAGAPVSNASTRGIGPGAPLQADAFDAPSPVSVSEAAKATQGGGHEGHQMRGITPGQDRENPPTPMPATRDGGAGKTAAASDHSQHGAAAATIYACPMHPEVTSDKPGTCPKCGMALVEKK